MNRADPKTYLAEVVARLAQSWPDNRTINLVAHGHSVPAGYFDTPTVDTFNAYPHLIHVRLKQRFPTAVINMIVTARGGEHSVSGATRFQRDVLPLKPDVLLIDYALNDRGLSLEQARQAWGQMIQQALDVGAKIILLTPTLDQRADLNDPADPLNRQANQVRQLAAEFGVGLADSFEASQAALRAGLKIDELMSHVNHPNRRGHEVVVGELWKWFPEK